MREPKAVSIQLILIPAIHILSKNLFHFGSLIKARMKLKEYLAITLCCKMALPPPNSWHVLEQYRKFLISFMEV